MHTAPGLHNIVFQHIYILLPALIALVQNVSLDDEALLESVRVKEPSDLTTTTLTSTQQALLLGLWSVRLSSISLLTLMAICCGA